MHFQFFKAFVFEVIHISPSISLHFVIIVISLIFSEISIKRYGTLIG